MKKFLIAEAEKERILGMHYDAMGKELVNEGKFNRDSIAELIMQGVESDHSAEQELAWALLRQAGMPFFERAAFLAAADLAIEISEDGGSNDEPPRAA
jgi:hypothetical protein